LKPKVVVLSKANTLSGRPIYGNCEILIGLELPTSSTPKKLYINEAKRLLKALEDYLPRGTFDNLLAEMLKKKANFLDIRFSEAYRKKLG